MQHVSVVWLHSVLREVLQRRLSRRGTMKAEAAVPKMRNPVGQAPGRREVRYGTP